MTKFAKNLLSTAAVIAVFAASATAQAASSNTSVSDVKTDACQVSWKSIDTDNNGKISKSEAESNSDAEFKRIDADNNGIVSMTEWQACAAPVEGPPMKSVDAASIGSSSTDASTEASQTSPASSQTADSDMDRPAGGMRDEANWTDNDFAALDTDKSGGISADEAAAAGETGSAANGKKASEAAMRSAWKFAAIDSDGNGEVSKQEWQKRDAASIDARFEKLDKDGNGELTQSEFKQYRSQRFSEAQKANSDEPTVWIYYYYVL